MLNFLSSSIFSSFFHLLFFFFFFSSSSSFSFSFFSSSFSFFLLLFFFSFSSSSSSRCYVSAGFSRYGQPEVVFLLRRSMTEDQPPQDPALLIRTIFRQALRGDLTLTHGAFVEFDQQVGCALFAREREEKRSRATQKREREEEEIEEEERRKKERGYYKQVSWGHGKCAWCMKPWRIMTVPEQIWLQYA